MTVPMGTPSTPCDLGVAEVFDRDKKQHLALVIGKMVQGAHDIALKDSVFLPGWLRDR